MLSRRTRSTQLKPCPQRRTTAASRPRNGKVTVMNVAMRTPSEARGAGTSGRAAGTATRAVGGQVIVGSVKEDSLLLGRCRRWLGRISWLKPLYIVYDIIPRREKADLFAPRMSLASLRGHNGRGGANRVPREV